MPKKNIFSTNIKITGYINSGNLCNARSLFDSMVERTVVTWTMLIGGYIQNNRFREALGLYADMCRQGTKPNHVTLATLLSGFTEFETVNEVSQVHAHVVKLGCDSILKFSNLLLISYCKTRNMGAACHLFEHIAEKDNVTFNALLTGYSKVGFNHDAIRPFFRMLDLGIRPTKLTFAAVLRAGIQLDDIEFGQQVHSFAVKSNFVWDVFVANALLDFYSKHGRVVDVRKLFLEMPELDGISYNILINCYATNERVKESLELFRELQCTRFDRRQFPYATLLSIAANALNLEMGKQIHSQVIVTGAISNVFSVNALLDMYAKCGSIKDALQMFQEMPVRNTVSWNALISAYAQNGDGDLALRSFEQMVRLGLQPTSVSFLCILSACSHCGLVDEGLQYFKSMTQVYKLVPKREHYASVVDMLCRSGRFDEAEELMTQMPFEPHPIIWRSILNSCRIHKHQELAKKAADQLSNSKVLRDAASYVSMSNIYAEAGEWDNVGKVRKAMRERGVRNVPGYSWVEIKH